MVAAVLHRVVKVRDKRLDRSAVRGIDDQRKLGVQEDAVVLRVKRKHGEKERGERCINGEMEAAGIFIEHILHVVLVKMLLNALCKFLRMVDLHKKYLRFFGSAGVSRFSEYSIA